MNDTDVNAVRRAAVIFCRKHATADPDEVFGEALLIAVTGLRKFDAGRLTNGGTLAGWLTWYTTQKLFERARRSPRWLRKIQKSQGVPYLADDWEFDWQVTPPKFSLRRLLFDLSDDAGRVLSLVLYRNQTNRKVIKQIMRDAGWSAGRVIDAFLEIRDAL